MNKFYRILLGSAAAACAVAASSSAHADVYSYTESGGSGLTIANVGGGSVSETMGTLENADGGQFLTAILTWRIPKLIMSNPPERNTRISARGKDWIIREVRSEPWAAEHVVRASQQ